ncbi:MAG TPA: 3-keto-5-aminohexanoate cleavage protein [Candidatus Limnocylindrales bacterium]|nr:3-keto-5-aminohexanoate cleavage protein [Candidatus Limnocylindrales bacterium]
MLIQAALNGSRTQDENPAVPISPAEIAASANGAVAAGARELHFHVRAADGRESVAPVDVAAAVSAVRAAASGIRFGVSTGLWILPDAAKRHIAVAGWNVLPDYASVNIKEEGAVELAKVILSRGMGIEAGFTDLRGVDVFLESGLAPRCLRVLLEPLEEDFEAALQTVAAIESALDRGGVKISRLLHGFNQTAWDVIDAAVARGYDTRIGFEDILALPNGTPAPSNASLISAALRRTKK